MVPRDLADKFLQGLALLIVVVRDLFHVLAFQVRDQAGNILVQMRLLFKCHSSAANGWTNHRSRGNMSRNTAGSTPSRRPATPFNRGSNLVVHRYLIGKSLSGATRNKRVKTVQPTDTVKLGINTHTAPLYP